MNKPKSLEDYVRHFSDCDSITLNGWPEKFQEIEDIKCTCGLDDALCNAEQKKSGPDLQQIERNIDEALASETEESLQAFLEKRRQAPKPLPEVEIKKEDFYKAIKERRGGDNVHMSDDMAEECFKLSTERTRQIFEKVLPTKKWIENRWPEHMNYADAYTTAANDTLTEIQNRLNNLK